MDKTLGRRLGAELLGTYVLVLGGTGAAVLAAKFLVPTDGSPVQLGIGFLGVSLAFGLTVLTMAYAVGHISGGHFNPAVTLGLVTGRRFPPKDALPYIIVQVVGAIAASATLWLIAINQKGQTKDALAAAAWLPTATEITLPANSISAPGWSPRSSSRPSSSS